MAVKYISITLDAATGIITEADLTAEEIAELEIRTANTPTE